LSVEILEGDCRDVLRTLDDSSVHAIVTDPPYELGFMGKAWDKSGIAYDGSVWTECLRVLKPGGFLLAFGGTRTYHRLACAIEDGGFEVRDMLSWLYGSGFPKGTDKAKIPPEWAGWNTALKPACEPICMARKPMQGTLAQNLAQWGTGALNIDGCRIGETGARNNGRAAGTNGIYGEIGATTPIDYNKGRWPANVIHDSSDEVLAAFPVAPRQIADASSSSSSRKTQTVYGAMKRGNGRDGEASADAENAGVVGFKMRPGARREDAGSAARFFYCAKASRKDRNAGCGELPEKAMNWSSGEQSPGTFQSPNTNRAASNFHPTVKPTELMRWLVRLVTPPGGTVLDPFAGSGSTGRAASIEGFDAILIELNPEYAEIARRRIHGDAPLLAQVSSGATP
jgi:DNA modification methylase